MWNFSFPKIKNFTQRSPFSVNWIHQSSLMCFQGDVLRTGRLVQGSV
jgi:hypothetical protein